MSKKENRSLHLESTIEVPEGVTMHKCGKFGEELDEVVGHEGSMQIICEKCGGVNQIPIPPNGTCFYYVCAYGDHTLFW